MPQIIEQIATRPNLRLAWGRIEAGANIQYKSYFRDLYAAYAVALEVNLTDLRARLLGGSYRASQPERIYLPKVSGLHRPIGLLCIEDQIVLQAIANIAAHRVQRRRAALQHKTVFSNILQSPDSIFFFKPWSRTYKIFQDRIRNGFLDGMHWVGDFDLAAFYDTISHELLLKTVFPRTPSYELIQVKQYLGRWSSDLTSSGHEHGLPQGPLASDFLAECFLLPIDAALKSQRGYLRYVDDVRLLGISADDVRKNLSTLERQCLERGLIPQAGKFAIKRAFSIREALGSLPSIAERGKEAGEQRLITVEARRILRESIGGKPYRVIDKTRLRFVLYRALPDQTILTTVLKLIPHHPEHAEAFFHYLSRFPYRRRIENLCSELVASSPSPFVRGKAWHMMARYFTHRTSHSVKSGHEFVQKAAALASRHGTSNFAERWGAVHYLCVASSNFPVRINQVLKRQPMLMQALLAPVLPHSAFTSKGAASSLITSPMPEPGLAICASLRERKIQLRTLGIKANSLSSQVRNVCRELGLIRARKSPVDAIAEILLRSYGVAQGKSWRKLLGREYWHALGVLRQAETTRFSNPSYWIISQNSFNHAIFLGFQRHALTGNHPGRCKVLDKKGEMISFGNTSPAPRFPWTVCNDLTPGERGERTDGEEADPRGSGGSPKGDRRSPAHRSRRAIQRPAQGGGGAAPAARRGFGHPFAYSRRDGGDPERLAG